MSISNNSNSSSSASIPSILVEALHQPGQAAEQDTTAAAMMEMGKGKMGLGANAFLLKKMAATGQSFYSPTDTMVSPCTKKLVQSKKRHYTKGKPLTLSNSFQASQPNAFPSAPVLKSTLSTSSLGQSSTPQQSENQAPTADNDTDMA